MGKNICIFSDGTGQAGGVKPDQRLSNVYKIYRAARVDPFNVTDPAKQVCFYDPGLGTDDDVRKGITGLRRSLNKLLSSATGRGITHNIVDCYEAILNLYEPGDRIYLFGFSRGAYTTRCVANLISLCGIPATDGEGNPFPKHTSSARAIAHETVVKAYEYGEAVTSSRILRRDKNSVDGFGQNISQVMTMQPTFIHTSSAYSTPSRRLAPRVWCVG